MSKKNEIINSPTGWVADHIARYVATNGEDGHIWRGVTCLLLTTTGRKSGDPRRTALIYGRDGNDYVIVASNGGQPTHPLWYTNIIANENVTLQVAGDVFEASATTMPVGVAHDRAWATMVSIWPDYGVYQTKTTRQIPLIRIRRI